LIALKNKPITVVTPSQWLKKFSEQSETFQGKKHYHILNSLDTNIFKPLDKYYARHILNIPQYRKVILISAYSLKSYNKGFDLFTKAIQDVKSDADFYISALGAGELADTSIPIHYLGQIQDERLLSVAYNAADCLVIPSRNENYPNVIIEALSCGIPVIGFPIGGLQEAIQHEKNGYLCPEISIDALKVTIEKFLANPQLFDKEKIAQEAREKYALEVQAKKYIDIYNTLL
jgi:glycosyltransferase involved in cell wall biosynthesis